MYQGEADSMKRSFTVVIERDPETHWLVGQVVELPGCYTQAKDLSSLEANIREAIQVYTETVKDKKPQSDYVATWRVEVVA
jgi:predicted RNase H-like HicB family nuclease